MDIDVKLGEFVKMTILRNKKKSRFCTFENDLIRNPGLSGVEKSVLFCLLSLPPDWKVYESQLTQFLGDGIYAIRKAIKRLEVLGYIHRARIRNESGRFVGGYVYDVYEVPNLRVRVVHDKQAEYKDRMGEAEWKRNKELEKEYAINN